MQEYTHLLIKFVWPAVVLIMITYHMINFIKLKSSISKGNVLLLGKNKSFLYIKVIGIIIGIFLLIYGYLQPEVKDIGMKNYFFYLGMLVLIQSLLYSENYQLMFTKKYLKYKDLLSFNKMRYQRINSIHLSENFIQIQNVFRKYEYEFKSDEREKLILFMEEQLKGKFEVNNQNTNMS